MPAIAIYLSIHFVLLRLTLPNLSYPVFFFPKLFLASSQNSSTIKYSNSKIDTIFSAITLYRRKNTIEKSHYRHFQYILFEQFHFRKLKFAPSRFKRRFCDLIQESNPVTSSKSMKNGKGIKRQAAFIHRLRSFIRSLSEFYYFKNRKSACFRVKSFIPQCKSRFWRKSYKRSSAIGSTPRKIGR